MDLLQWTPVVFQTESRPGQVAPLLEFRAWLRCLFCGYVQEAVTKPTMLQHLRSETASGGRLIELGQTSTHLDSAESRSYAAAKQLEQERACEHCGFKSKLPDTQVASFKKAVARTVTLEWIDLQLEAIRPAEIQLRGDLEQILRNTVESNLQQMDLPGLVEQKIAGLDFLPKLKEHMRQVLKPLVMAAVKEALREQG